MGEFVFNGIRCHVLWRFAHQAEQYCFVGRVTGTGQRERTIQRCLYFGDILQITGFHQKPARRHHRADSMGTGWTHAYLK